ncbi:MAG: Sir2 family NAD-dependent protein deacetylase [Bacteroidota bacterium]
MLPTTAPATTLDALVDLLRDRRIAVLVGAGLSTDSGIPDYRGPGTRHRKRRPIQYDDFVRSAAARQRYWARASRGWPRVAQAQPNAGHRALAQLDAAGRLTGTITQNVDGLDRAARVLDREMLDGGAFNGTEPHAPVIDLHGRLADVVCLACQRVYPRTDVQRWIAEVNPGHLEPFDADLLAPDGDFELADEAVARFVPPSCPACDGALKPDVVFFGESVPKPRVAQAQALVADADALLVVGSSLAVYSGYRFVRQADKADTPVAIVTLGDTRGHRHAAVALDAPLGTTLPALASRLLA